MKKLFFKKYVAAAPIGERKCRRCGCTDADCSGCIERTGRPCYWVEKDLCSACAVVAARVLTAEQSLRFLAYEASSWNRYQDEAEMLCLLLPVLVKASGLQPMNGYEAETFRRELRAWLDRPGTDNAVSDHLQG